MGTNIFCLTYLLGRARVYIFSVDRLLALTAPVVFIPILRRVIFSSQYSASDNAN